MPGIFALDQHLTRTFGASRPTGHLDGRLRETLARAEVRAEESLVRIQDHDKADVREMMPLRQHLRADQEAYLSTVDAFHDRIEFPLAADVVAIDAGERDARKNRLQRLL